LLRAGGAEKGLAIPSFVPMCAAEIETAAARDHENPPLTKAKAG
jgi:hypothetical protein